MVKHVVKPLFLKNLRENILLKKLVFTRLFLQRLQGLSMLCFLARSAFLPAGASPPVSCSQSTRATSRYKYGICNYSTCSYIITNLFRTVKWFNVLFLDFLKIFDADFVFRRHHLLYSFTNIFLFFPRGYLRNKKIPRRLGGGFYH